MGLGEGKGEDQTTNVVAGSCCAICCVVSFLVIGLPMLIGGVALVALYKDKYHEDFSDIVNQFNTNFSGVYDPELWDKLYKLGIAMIVVSVLCVVIGVIMVIMLCTGCCGQNKSSRSTVDKPNRPRHGVHPRAYVDQQGPYHPANPYGVQPRAYVDQQFPYHPGNPYLQQWYTGAQPQQQYYREQETYPQKVFYKYY